MSALPPAADAALIDDLRREIDRIDDALHDLLMRRTQVVEQIGRAKSGSRVFLRPGREAVILRRLAARHTGPLPITVITRMWRELIAGLTRLQGPYAITVWSPEDRRGFWDVARDHFGSQTPMSAVSSVAAAIRSLTDGTASAAVVPMPAEDDSELWWPLLMSDDSKTPRVVARLPFFGRGNARGEDGDALVLAVLPHEPTGDDHTLVGIEVGEDISRGRLKDMLEQAGLLPTPFGAWLARTGAPGSFHLVEIADYVAADDPRLAVFARRVGEALIRQTLIGGYAVPLFATDAHGS